MPREPELYKDKIEVSLDGRQIFYLFFGGAVIVGLVFVLGVMVGRRVEARGHVDHARTSTAADPLAALDRLEPRPNLTYQERLQPTANAPSPTTEVEKKISELANAREAKKAEKKPDAGKPDAVKKLSFDDAKPAKKPDAPKPDKKSGGEAANPDVITQLDDDKKPDDKKPDDKKAEKADKPKAKFTLQLSSFQDKAEAESFLSSVKAAGYQPYVTEAEVSGKGTFYRVRLGSYRTMEAANDAKADVEKSLKKSASVMRL